MKKGFTLVEIVAVLVILGIIGVVTIPTIATILKEDSEKIYQNQLNQIEKAAKDWAYSNMDILPTKDNPYVTVQLSTLQQTGFLPLNIKNPKDDSLIETATITIQYKNEDYFFEITNINNADTKTEFTNESPRLILNGSSLEYVELNSEYVEKGVIAQDYLGNTIDQSRVQTIYKYLETEVSGITTNQFRTFTVTYIVNDMVNGEEYSSKIMKTVIVRDTTVPELVVGDSLTITLEEAKNLNLLEGVSVSDNDINSVSVSKVEVSGFDRVYGEKIVTYRICDNSNNCTTKRRIIKIAEVYKDNSGASTPELVNGMIPVIWNGTNWVYVDSTIKASENKEELWYNYEDKKWANAVVLKNNPSKTYQVNETIIMDDIALMFVWIPRYEYKLPSGSIGSTGTPDAIDIKFIDSTKTAADSGYHIHPGFTFDGVNKNGLWYGKFEASSTDTICTSYYTNDSSISSSCNKIQQIIVKPNVQSIRYLNAANIYQSGLNVKNDYSLTNVDTHAAKYLEWTTASYLTNSIYGRCSSSTSCTEVSRNDSSRYYTGRSDGLNGSGINLTALGTYTYETEKGQIASTTGNIYGIYDMSGGTWEYAMGVAANSSGIVSLAGTSKTYPSGFNGNYGEGGTVTGLVTPERKYYDVLITDATGQTFNALTKINNSTDLSGSLKDLMNSTSMSAWSTWYNDFSYLVSTNIPWMSVGGFHISNYQYGIFSTNRNWGTPYYDATFRLILVIN